VLVECITSKLFVAVVLYGIAKGLHRRFAEAVATLMASLLVVLQSAKDRDRPAISLIEVYNFLRSAMR